MEGVAAANALGVLHRDLKPSNIFVCMGVSGRLDDPRVLDFGISKLDDELELPLTRSGVAVGTPYYMPLEQLTGQRDLDARVDVYAMGVILYEAISGVVPHAADNVAALALRLMHTPPVHLSSRRPDLPRGLAAVVMRALARDRDARYKTMRALIEAVLPFIPESARLTVCAPEGIRLRTPRDTGEPAVAEEMAAAAATTEAAAGERRSDAVPRSYAALDPGVATPAPAQPSRRPPARSRHVRFAISAALAGAGALWVATWRASEPRAPTVTPRSVTGQLAPADATVPRGPTQAEPTRGATATTAPDASSTPLASSPPPSPVRPAPVASPPRPTRHKLRVAPAQPARAASLEQTASPDEATTSTPASVGDSRAGSLSPDEF
jgi:serine/threonine-protein kinase